ncbi:MAG: hypothetical protein JW837_18770 [Sedimentisphaerales bacterium]|nr:hypothetical protein [Sedimentisphaerales bacterium]
MRFFIIGLWRGNLGPANTFWAAHVAVWGIGMFFFQFLSKFLSMNAKPLIGLPLGLVFLAYNVAAFVGVIRSTRNAKVKRWSRIVMCLASAMLLLLSCWVALYFLGRPMFSL